MKILHILRTRPDVTVEKLMHSATNGDRAKVTALYEFQKDSDWSQLVDENFSKDKDVDKKLDHLTMKPEQRLAPSIICKSRFA